MSLICITLNDKTISKLSTSVEKCKSLGADVNVLEFRLDYLEPPISSQSVEELSGLKIKNGPQIILTLRPTWEGGKFTGAEEERLSILQKGIELGFDYIDVELNMAEAQRNELISKAKEKGIKTIVSYHDFEKTPDWKEILEKIEQCSTAGGDVAKVVFTNNNFEDALNVLKAGKAAFEKNHKFTALGMGKYGYVSRILSPVIGNALVYASSDLGKPVVEGQVDINTLRGIYNSDKLDTNTQICGIIGNPLGHTLSPKMHNAAFKELGLNFVYLPIEIPKDRLGTIIDGLKALNFRGINVTIPYKQEITQYLDELDANALEIGAVNTIVNDDGRLIGYNTDSYGASQALKSNGVEIDKNKGKVLILGAGGAARAAAFSLAKTGQNIIIANRTYETAEKLANELNKISSSEAIRISEINDVINDVTILINCTPLSLSDTSSESVMPLELIRNDMVIFDMVYTPKYTPLLIAGQKVDAKIIFGYDMLVHQGAKSFELWTGKLPHLQKMREVVLAELGG